MNVQQNEALIFCNYLIREKPSKNIIERYNHFVGTNSVVISAHDQKIIHYALKNPRSIPFLDSALALLEPSSELRRRIFTMFTILEATPLYAEKFLPVKRNPIYLLPLVLSGIIAVLQALLGIVLLKVIIR